MKKCITSILLILSILLFMFTIQYKYTIHQFSHKAVIDNIKYLSSDNLKGRLPGTFENEQASTYIRNEFKEAQLLPLNKDYYEQFSTEYPKRITQSEPYLKVIDNNNNIIKEYIYGQDFKEDMINFKVNQFSFNNKDNVKYDANYIKILRGTSSIIFYSSENNNLNFRSSFSSTAPYALCIIAKKETLSEIQSFLSKDFSIKCSIPYTVDKTILNNVVGFIKGSNSSNSPLILSAHFDHLGTDISGNIYNGALDNASGVSFIIEMSKYIRSLGEPDRDIIFAAFNAEEFGFKGSTAFLEKHNNILKDSKIFNFDMIGGSTSVPLSIMGSKKDTTNTKLIRSVSNICSNEHIYYNYLFEDASDHEPFREKNIDAITFCDNDITRIHTTNDKFNFINAASIDRCFKVSSKEIIACAYSKNPLVLYYKQIYIASLISMIVWSAVLFKEFKLTK